MQLLPVWFWQNFLTQKQMNFFPKQISPLANLDTSQVGLWQCLKTVFLKSHLFYNSNNYPYYQAGMQDQNTPYPKQYGKKLA